MSVTGSNTTWRVLGTTSPEESTLGAGLGRGTSGSLDSSKPAASTSSRRSWRSKVTAKIARAHAESEFEKYHIVQDRLFESNFDRVVAETKRLGEGTPPAGIRRDTRAGPCARLAPVPRRGALAGRGQSQRIRRRPLRGQRERQDQFSGSHVASSPPASTGSRNAWAALATSSRAGQVRWSSRAITA
jgi:hypothetical protein